MSEHDVASFGGGDNGGAIPQLSRDFLWGQPTKVKEVGRSLFLVTALAAASPAAAVGLAVEESPTREIDKCFPGAPAQTQAQGQPSSLVVKVEAFLRDLRAARLRAEFKVISGDAVVSRESG